MAIPLTEDQKLAKKQQDVLLKDKQSRQSVINFPTNTQIGQEVPLMNQAKAPQVPGEVQQAQTMASEGFKSPLQGQVQDVAQQAISGIQTPEQVQAAKEAKLAGFDVQKSKAIESFRRSTGGIAGSSDRNQELLNRFTTGAFERAQLGASLDEQAAERKRQDLLAAHQIGSQTLGQQEQTFQNQIVSLLQSAEGGRQFQAMNIDEKLAYAEIASREGMQLSDQQFQDTQNARQEKLSLALQANDINAVRENLQAQLQFNKEQAAAGRVFTADQNALDRATSLTLANLDIEGQKAITELRGEIDKGLLLTEGKINAVENSLDRALEIAVTDKNISGQMDIVKAQGEIDKIKQANAQAWATAERQSTQNWTSNERLSVEEHQKALQYIDIKAKEMLQGHQENLALALQAGDKDTQLKLQANAIENNNYIEGMREKLAIKLSTQDMNHDEAMMRLSSEIQTARDEGNYVRQRALTEYAAQQEMNMLEASGEQAKALAYIDNNLKIALQTNDFENAKILTNMKHRQELEYQANDKILRDAELALQKEGMDLTRIFGQWDQIQQAIESGQASPESGLEFLRENLPQNLRDIVQPPDPYALQKAITEDFTTMKLQYAQSHPEAAMYTRDDQFLDLNDNALEGFNKWLNENLYDEEGPKEKTPVNYSYTGGSPNQQRPVKYKLKGKSHYSGSGNVPEGATNIEWL